MKTTTEHRTVESERCRWRLKRLALADDGQATAEYALVMLAAASLAGLLLAWVTSTDAVGRLMDAVLDSILSGI